MNIHPQTPSLRHRRVEQVGIGLSLLVQNGFFLEGEIKLFWNIQNKKCVEEFLRNFKIFQNIPNKKCVEDFLRNLGGFFEDFCRILWGHWRCYYGFAQNFILDISKKFGARTAKPSKNLRNQRLLGSQKSKLQSISRGKHVGSLHILSTKINYFPKRTDTRFSAPTDGKSASRN